MGDEVAGPAVGLGPRRTQQLPVLVPWTCALVPRRLPRRCWAQDQAPTWHEASTWREVPTWQEVPTWREAHCLPCSLCSRRVPPSGQSWPAGTLCTLLLPPAHITWEWAPMLGATVGTSWGPGAASLGSLLRVQSASCEPLQ